MIIRKASVLDLSVMVEGGKAAMTWVYPDKEIHTDNLYSVLYKLITQGVCFVAERNGKVIGAIGGNYTSNLFWPQEVQLIEIFWWVKPAYRYSSAAYRLMKRFVQYGKEHEEITQVIFSSQDISPFSDEMYLKRGFIAKEKLFLMEV